MIPWVLFFGLFALGAVLNFVAARRRGRPQNQAQDSATQIVAAKALTTSPIDVDAYFLHTYCGQLQAETEKNVQIMINSRPADERIGLAVRFISTMLAKVIYDELWINIFHSQILVLQEINVRILRIEQVRVYYDAAEAAYPNEYGQYSFVRWVAFLRDQLLVIDHPADTIGITVKGKDFLKYMLHQGYKPEQRQY